MFKWLKKKLGLYSRVEISNERISWSGVDEFTFEKELQLDIPKGRIEGYKIINNKKV